MTGNVSFSVEIELGWANHDGGTFDHVSKRRERETRTLQDLLDLCDELGIRFTFDVVGHLLQAECDGTHSDRPGDEDWFANDPGSDVDTDPLFYAPDLIEAIRRSDVDHEICTHTYSHTPLADVSVETAEWELQRARTAHERAGLEWSRAFVPPRHSPPPRSALASAGIDVLRTPHPKRTFDMSRVERLYYHVLSDHPVLPSEVDEGVTRVYSSPYLSLAAPHLPHGQLDAHPVFRALPRSVRARRHRRYLLGGLERARAGEGIGHFWSHLWDISNDVQWPIVAEFLEHAATAHSTGDVEIKTLSEHAIE